MSMSANKCSQPIFELRTLWARFMVIMATPQFEFPLDNPTQSLRRCSRMNHGSRLFFFGVSPNLHRQIYINSPNRLIVLTNCQMTPSIHPLTPETPPLVLPSPWPWTSATPEPKTWNQKLPRRVETLGRHIVREWLGCPITSSIKYLGSTTILWTCLDTLLEWLVTCWIYPPPRMLARHHQDDITFLGSGDPQPKTFICHEQLHPGWAGPDPSYIFDFRKVY